MGWRLIAAAVALLPWRALGIPGGVLGWLAGSVLRIRRRHAASALRRAGIVEARAVLREMYSSLGTLVFELLWTAGRPGHDLSRFVEHDEAQWRAVDEAVAKGRGLVVATAHTGNWDLLACAMAARVPLMVVTRHLGWRSADRFWQALRARRGVELVDARGAVARATRHLRGGGVVAFLIDQRPLDDRHTVSGGFLGADAMHELAFAQIAARCRSPVAVAFSQRLAGGRHRLEIPAVIHPPDKPDRAWARVVTLRAAALLEGFVRGAPGQWLWLHRRWGSAR